jgi:hypothetical protein
MPDSVALKMLLNMAVRNRIKFRFWNTTWNQNVAGTAEAT